MQRNCSPWKRSEREGGFSVAGDATFGFSAAGASVHRESASSMESVRETSFTEPPVRYAGRTKPKEGELGLVRRTGCHKIRLRRKPPCADYDSRIQRASSHPLELGA